MGMKKIGILTFHDVENYGASLQCYALQTTLDKYGENIEVINYKPQRKWSKYGNWARFFSKAYMARVFFNLPIRKHLKQRSCAFRNFSNEFYNLGSKSILSENTISNACRDYDAIFFGSDQIWNLDDKMYDRSTIFYGDFLYSRKKFAYSASFGDVLSIAEKNKSYIQDKLSQFSKISVREQSGVEFLNTIGISASLTVDPTLFLSKEDWDRLAGETPILSGEYIVYYSCNGHKYSWKFAQRLSKKTGLRVINLNPHPKTICAGFENHYGFGPKEFLNCIKFSKYAVVNSFHGTVFSILFEKDFYSVFSQIKGNIKLDSRRYTILSQLGLEKNIVMSDSEITFFKTDWSTVRAKMIDVVEGSRKYLKECLDVI